MLGTNLLSVICVAYLLACGLVFNMFRWLFDKEICPNYNVKVVSVCFIYLHIVPECLPHPKL